MAPRQGRCRGRERDARAFRGAATRGRSGSDLATAAPSSSRDAAPPPVARRSSTSSAPPATNPPASAGKPVPPWGGDSSSPRSRTPSSSPATGEGGRRSASAMPRRMMAARAAAPIARAAPSRRSFSIETDLVRGSRGGSPRGRDEGRRSGGGSHGWVRPSRPSGALWGGRCWRWRSYVQASETKM